MKSASFNPSFILYSSIYELTATYGPTVQCFPKGIEKKEEEIIPANVWKRKSISDTLKGLAVGKYGMLKE